MGTLPFDFRADEVQKFVGGFLVTDGGCGEEERFAEGGRDGWVTTGFGGIRIFPEGGIDAFELGQGGGGRGGGADPRDGFDADGVHNAALFAGVGCVGIGDGCGDLRIGENFRGGGNEGGEFHAGADGEGFIGDEGGEGLGGEIAIVLIMFFPVYGDADADGMEAGDLWVDVL